MNGESKAESSDSPRTVTGFRGARFWILLAALIVGLGVLAAQSDDILLQQGCANLRARNHQRALEWLVWAEWLAPDRADVAFYLARANRRLERFDQVRSYLSKADRLGYGAPQLYKEQWIVLAQTSQFDEMQQHWPELFVDAADNGPEISNAYVTWCLSRLNLEDALPVIDAWQADFPQDSQPHFMRGQVYEVMLRWTDAVSEYQAALNLDEKRSDARFRLGNAYMHLLKNDEAMRELNQCLAVDPLHAEATVALAKCLLKMNDEPQARRRLQELLQREPEQVEALHSLGDLESSAGNLAAAEQALQRAVLLKPEDQTIRYALTQVLQRLGKREEAREHLQFVQEAVKPLLTLNNLTAELVQNPKNIELRFQIAQITWKYKSREEGAQWYRSLLDLAPDHARTHQALAEHYRLKGNTKKAEDHQLKADVWSGR